MGKDLLAGIIRRMNATLGMRMNRPRTAQYYLFQDAENLRTAQVPLSLSNGENVYLEEWIPS